MNLHRTVLRKMLVVSMAFSLAFTTLACTSASSEYSSGKTNESVAVQSASPSPTRISDGSYPVQQATYDDGTGEYTLMILNTKPGDGSVYRSTNLRMARLTEEDTAKGEKSHLEVENGEASLYLSEDFRIEYVHNVTETQVNPQTGNQETVVVRRESNFWTPFAGALAGQALGSLLFTPQYYFPPVYRPGVSLTGYGGYGRSYNDAVSSYRSRNNTAPAEVRNRQTFRTTGQIRRSPSSASRSPQVNQGNRSSGSGYGSSNLKRSNSSQPSKAKRSTGFGSSGSSTRRRVGGRRR